jgi:acetyl esterase/lipase
VAGRVTAAPRRIPAVPYADVPGFRPLELDLVLPAASGGPAPLVVALHGGGWRVGSRRSMGPAYADADPFAQFAAAGLAVASIDYRLSGEAGWPAQLEDARAALEWVRGHADELGVDPGRVGAWGESAGGHLAALLGLTAEPALAAVACWYTPSDLRALPGDRGADPADPATREAQLLGAPQARVPGRAADASPVARVHAAAPPFLLLHGRADRAVPYVQSERFAAALAAAGAAVTLHGYDGADHVWAGSADAAEDALARTITFLRAHLVPGRR